MPLDIFRDWRPVTIRAKSRETLAVGARDLKDHLARVTMLVARGDVRVVVRRHRDLMGALVPMPDHWFLVELEDELRRRDCPGAGKRVGGRDVVEAIIEIRERVKAAERKRLLELKRAQAAERKQAVGRRRARDGGAKTGGRS